MGGAATVGAGVVDKADAGVDVVPIEVSTELGPQPASVASVVIGQANTTRRHRTRMAASSTRARLANR
jgi:hypothetical protein